MSPFPHWIGEWSDPDLLRACRAEIPADSDPRWKRFRTASELKLEGRSPMWGPATFAYFDIVAERAPFFADLFGLPELHMETIGGGYHLIPPGGYLGVHTDFSKSSKTDRYRRVNVLTFLNDGWSADDGGLLELWDADGPVVEIAPEFGTTVAFVTSASSWHGHPKPTTRWRASLAAYFFTDTPPADFCEQSTVWHPNGQVTL